MSGDPHRTFVTFERELLDPERQPPFGGEISIWLRRGLMDHQCWTSNGDTTDYSYFFDVKIQRTRERNPAPWYWHVLNPARTFLVEVGSIGADVEQWLITTRSNVWLGRLLGSNDTKEHERLVTLVDGLLQADKRSTKIRWFTQEEFDANPKGPGSPHPYDRRTYKRMPLP